MFHVGSYFIHLCFIVFYCVLLRFCHGILHIDVLIYSAPQLQECLINLLTYWRQCVVLVSERDRLRLKGWLLIVV